MLLTACRNRRSRPAALWSLIPTGGRFGLAFLSAPLRLLPLEQFLLLLRMLLRQRRGLLLVLDFQLALPRGFRLLLGQLVVLALLRLLYALPLRLLLGAQLLLCL